MYQTFMKKEIFAVNLISMVDVLPIAGIGWIQEKHYLSLH